MCINFCHVSHSHALKCNSTLHLTLTKNLSTLSCRHNRVLPPPPSPSPTYSGSIVKSHSSANTAEYDTVDYEHVEIINVIYESVDDHKLTETFRLIIVCCCCVLCIHCNVTYELPNIRNVTKAWFTIA